MSEIAIISASAGSGKTYRLCQELTDAVLRGQARPEAVVATTFTNKAAAELAERVRVGLLAQGLADEAQRLGAARIGTVNAVCGRLVSEFAFTLGLSPRLEVLDEAVAARALTEALSRVVSPEVREEAERLRLRLSYPREAWDEDLGRMVQLARSNGVDAAALRASAARSLEGYGALLGKPYKGNKDLEQQLLSALEDLLGVMAGQELTAKATREAVQHAQRCRSVLAAGRKLPWADWGKLCKLHLPKKLPQAETEAVREAAAWQDRHPALLGDVRRWVTLLYEMAAAGLQDYEAHKRARGVMDFTDQETLTLQLLGRAEVRAHLAGQIDLVLVDEFQDTSPIQLSLFLALARVAGRMVWVGDQKQSIFGFRGTDPAIMDAAVQVILRGEEPQTLPRSWRSRRALVSLTSALFARAFATQGIPPGRVHLKPALKKAEEPADLGPVVEQWTYTSKSVPVDVQCVAAGVRQLLADPEVRVRAGRTGPSRPVRPGDVAVLCRSNKTCTDVAAELGALGIATVLARPGLFATLEGTAALAALRLFIDPRDSLARATLARLLVQPGEGTAWLQAALAEPRAAAFATLDAVAALGRAAQEHPTAGALAALDLALQAADLRELCLRWGDAPRRLANLDRLRAHAVSYAEGEERGASGPSPTGLVHYLEQLSADAQDTQSALASEDAVTVSTWHKAKGLEWPVTVLFELQKLYSGEALGVKVAEERQGLDLADPLAGRFIRYWPSPYGGHKKDLPVFDRLQQHPAQQLAAQREAAQELRLLYVGWTRARDRLVLADRDKGWGQGLLGLLRDEEGPLLSDPGEGATRVTWAGETVALRQRRLSPEAAVPRSCSPGSAPVAPGPADHPPAQLYPSQAETQARLGELTRVGEQIPLRGDADMQRVGEAVHGFLATDRPALSGQEREAMACGLLQRWGVAAALSPGHLLAASDNLRRWAEGLFPGARWRREWPVRHRLPGGTEVRGLVDLVLETDEALVLLDHKSFPGALVEGDARLCKFAGQLSVYAAALQVATGKAVRATYLHLPLSGQVVQVRVG